MATREQSFHVRSVSLPSRSHPTVVEIEEKLQRLRSCAESESSSPGTITSEAICSRLTHVSELYQSIDGLLQLPRIQQSLFLCNLKELESSVDGSVRMLDACGSLKDAAATLKELVQGLQLVLRRAGDDASQEKVHGYIRSRKETQKTINKSYKEVKQICGRLQSASAIAEDSELVMKVLSEAREITASLLRSVISFMSMSSTTLKVSKWSLVSKAMQRKRISCEADLSGMPFLDATLCASLKDAGNASMAQSQLLATEISLGGLENGLQSLFRRLIQNRVSLLNILSL